MNEKKVCDEKNASGRIDVVGIGPGSVAHMTQAALQALESADIVIGYKTYIDLIKTLIADKEILMSGMRREVDRCEAALTEAQKGKRVVLVSSGDAGIYGMAGIMLEVALDSKNVPVEVIPGVTAAGAAASRLGAPIMHDFVTISLSDLLTEWDLIERRLHCAGQGDFVVCIYNPKSHGRPHQIEKAQEILLKYKVPETPVGIVRGAMRDGETVTLTTLGDMLHHEIDMTSTVIVGNACTFVKAEKMITPRGYRR